MTANHQQHSVQNGRIKLLSFGEALWDIIDGREFIGGAPFNLAAHGAQCGLDSFLLTRVGADDLGRRALTEIDRMNVNRQFVQTDKLHPTGMVTVQLAADGQPSYTIHEDAAWDYIDVPSETAAGLAAEKFDVICFGSLAQRSPVPRQSLLNLLDGLKGTPAFFDVNLRQNYYSRDLLAAGLQRTTVLKLNDSEVEIVARLIMGRSSTAQEFARAIMDVSPVRVVLITMGAEGCAVAEGRNFAICPAERVTVADTVGAGDAFSAAFLAGWLGGKPAIEAAAMGNRLGAFVASRRGAIPDYDAAIRLQLGL